MYLCQVATKVATSDRVESNSPTNDSSSQRGRGLGERSRSWFGLDLLNQAQVCILYPTVLH
jgi:hypothetical protein